MAAIGLYGDTGQDDLIGGTSQGTGSVADGDDDIWGGQGARRGRRRQRDDHARTGRRLPGRAERRAGYDCNTFRRRRRPERRHPQDPALGRRDDRPRTPTAGTSGDDTIGGQDGHDRLYGQGGGDDIKGGANDDFAFGNAGADTILGGDGQDDLIGGTGRTDSATQATATDGRLDAGDLIYGEADFDAIAGDNSRMVRQTDGDRARRTTAPGRRTPSTPPSTG